MRILWKLESADKRRASTRYRAFYPAGQLEKLGHEVTVSSTILPGRKEIREFDCIVFSKSFRLNDLQIVENARVMNVPYILDLCDNIFLEDYGGDAGVIMRVVFMAMAKHAFTVVTPTEQLASVVRDQIPAHVPVIVINDPLETWDLASEVFDIGFWNAVQQEEPSGQNQTRFKNLVRLGVSGVRLGVSVWRRFQRIWRFGLAVQRFAVNSPSEFISKAGVHFSGIKSEILHRLVLVFKPTPKKIRVLLKATGSAENAGNTKRAAPKTIIWFGFHGGPYADFGMTNLLYIRHTLMEIAKEVPIRLLVVSNNRNKYERFIRPFPFPTEYRKWHPRHIFRDIAESDVCVLPNSRDSFSLCKSANRAVFALSLGVPVVATETPALDPLEDMVIQDDWAGGIKAYLCEPGRAHHDVGAAQRIIEEEYSLRAVGERWLAVLDEVVGRSLVRCSETPPVVIFFLDLIQDLDVVLPVIAAVQARSDLVAKVWVTDRLVEGSPRVLEALGGIGVNLQIVPRRKIITSQWPEAFQGDALVTASESTGGPHRAGHALAQTASACGFRTYTFQHGLENIGLTYRDEKYDSSIRFVSERIFLWGPLGSLPSWVSSETRKACVPVGCPKEIPDAPPDNLPLPNHSGPVIGVFENLHWERYNDEYAARFVSDLVGAIEKYSDTLFVVKPHHAGQWLTQNFKGKLPDRPNMVIAAPDDPLWEPFTAPAIIAAVDRVITTPSTVALDSARMGRPVAIVGNGLDLPAYAPLPILNSPEGWGQFIESREDEAMAETLAFIDRSILPVPPEAAIRRIVDFIRRDLGLHEDSALQVARAVRVPSA